MEMRIKKGNAYMEFLVQCFKDKTIVPIVGAGLSCGVKTGNGQIPTGNELITHMLSEIKKNENISNEEYRQLENANFSEICAIYEEDDIVEPHIRRNYFKNNLHNAKYDSLDFRNDFFRINWPYIYSLNIDDVIENSSSYRTVILPNRDFDAQICDEERCLFKLHGDINDIIKYKDSSKVFTSREYAESILSSRSILGKLQTDYTSINVLIIGCSLKDEMDLLSLNKMGSIINQNNDSEHFIKRNLLFVVGEPTLTEKTRYKQFGITDVAVFDDYESMYKLLYSSWNKSQKVKPCELDCYRYYKEINFDAKDKSNSEYYYMALNPVDTDNRIINFPFYYIDRKLVTDVIKKTNDYSVQFVMGPMFSGKTYFLMSIYRFVKEREVYYFPSNVHLSDEALKELLNSNGILALFDTDSLSYDQVNQILRHEKTNNSYVIMLNTYNSDILSLISIMEQEDEEYSKKLYFHRKRLTNRLTKKERQKINNKFPKIKIIPMNTEETFINHLIRVSEESGIKTKYSEFTIPREDKKELALSIALASFESLTYEQIVMFEFVDIINDIVKEKAPLIEMVKTSSAERSGTNMSGLKYVLNSKYWMRSGLNSIVDKEDLIIEAYRYLIMRCIDFLTDDVKKKRSRYKKIIYFDTINDIFSENHFGHRSLVTKIYTNLEDLLGSDYQYNHQRAKCLMRNAHYLKHGSFREYNEALNSALIAKNQVLNAMDISSSEKLRISLAHIEYTIASIMSSICQCERYKNHDRIEKTIDICLKSIENVYNVEDVKRDLYYYKKNMHKYGAIYFIYSLVDVDVQFSKRCKNQYEQLLNYLINYIN